MADFMEMTALELKLLGLAPSALPLEAASTQLGEHADSIRRAVEHLRELGWLEAERRESADWQYTEFGIRAHAEGLPEIRLLQSLSGGSVLLASLPPDLSRVGLGFAKRAGWVALDGAAAKLTDAGKEALEQRATFALPLSPADLPPERLADLRQRGLVREHKTAQTLLTITAAGKEALLRATSESSNSPVLSPSSSSNSIGAIDRPLMQSGEWKKKPLRRYDVTLPVEPALPARRHPISRLREKIRTIFLSMGFEEMQGELAESAFWNFDALFQPQDHPARDLADTFYLPGQANLPARELTEAVRSAHEDGWKYSWQEGPARGRVLRTHTTAVSARTLHATSKDPRARKFFSVGKVFRNEATDYKHLAEFFQVEGIIVHPQATLGHLLGTLKAFYAKLGFSQIRFRPSYFPYTEPSLEIEVFHPARQTWLELGGAGVFRPEVCGPLGNRYPVLAWGLSLERPLMLANKIEDIRTLYRNDLDWLRHFPVE